MVEEEWKEEEWEEVSTLLEILAALLGIGGMWAYGEMQFQPFLRFWFDFVNKKFKPDISIWMFQPFLRFWPPRLRNPVPGANAGRSFNPS